MSNQRRDRRYLNGDEKKPADVNSPETETASERSTVTTACDCGRDHGQSITRRTALGALAGTAASVVALQSSELTLPAAAQEEDTFTVVHDLHSHSEIGEPDEPNIARYQSIISEELRERDDVFFMGSGDELGSSLISFFTEGEHKVEFMNKMDLTLCGVGNHDFDYGIDSAFDKFEASEFPWLTANLKTPDGEQLPHTEPYHIEEVNDTRIGIFNVVLRGFHGITDYPEDYIQEDPVEVAEEMTEYLRTEEECDVVLLSSHVNHETHYEIAETVDGLDAIFGSHSHVTFDEADLYEGTVISEIGYAYHHLGVMTFDSDGELVEWQRVDLIDDEGEPVDIDPDPEFKQMIEAQRAEIDDQISEVVGETETMLDASGAVNYGRESRLGNLIADTLLDYYEQADVAFQNSGGIRTNEQYGPGELTLQDILEINPFDNEIVLFETTGEDIIDNLRNRIDYLGGDAPFGAQQSMQVAGLQYEWRGHDEPELLNVFVNGEPLDPNETYTVATTDYYGESFAVDPENWDASSGARYGPAVGEYIQENTPVAPELENRILRVDETVELEQLTRDEQTVRIQVTHPGDVATDIHTDTFRVIDQEGAELAAQAVTVEGEQITAEFDADAYEGFEDQTDNPTIRLFGEFEPDAEAYGFTDEDGEQRALPAASAYDGFKLRATVTEDEPIDDDPTPGFGVAAAAAGAGTAAYLAKKAAEDEKE